MRAGMAVLDLAGQDADPLLRDGVNGYRVRAGVQACLARLLELYADRDLLQQLRNAAHQIAGAPASEAVAFEAYVALLDEMLDELRNRRYEKPPPLYSDPVLGALSLPPMFQTDPAALGFKVPP